MARRLLRSCAFAWRRKKSSVGGSKITRFRVALHAARSSTANGANARGEPFSARLTAPRHYARKGLNGEIRRSGGRTEKRRIFHPKNSLFSPDLLISLFNLLS
jgi:hypothetical protein